MKYVLDASVALKWVLPEPDSAKADQLRTEFVNGIHQLLAPEMFPVEVAHALARAERKKLLAPPQGSILLADVLTTLPRLVPALPDLLPKSFAIASRRRIGVYDCLYVALAQQEHCELITADIKLVRVLQPHYPLIVLLGSLP
jgi:predicted nucleic acid-binding protein